jgi:predicted dehydrogenase
MIDGSKTDRNCRWGIIGTGSIAGQLADDLALVHGADRSAVLSRNSRNAADFAAQKGFSIGFADRDAFFRSGLDLVYIATPTANHERDALDCISAGIGVVVEKPLAMSSEAAERMAQAAKRADVLLMEAMWTRFLPAIGIATTLHNGGLLGDIRRIEAELSFAREFNPASRFFNPELGGGALLDLGVYPLSLALLFLGSPSAVSGGWQAAPTGVDISARVDLQFNDATARLRCGFNRDGINCFTLFGSTATLSIEAPFLKAERMRAWDKPMQRVPFSGAGLINRIGRRLPLPGVSHVHRPIEGHGLLYEARAAQHAWQTGQITEPLSPPQSSMEVLRIIEAVLQRPPESGASQ